MPTALRTVMLVVVLLALLSACSGPERPDAANWLPHWDEEIAVIPPQDDLGDPPDKALCQDTLAMVREENEDLLPSPSVTVDDLVTEWIEVAEAAFFDCPPEGEDIDSFDAAYEELARIQESVETALSSEG